MNGRPPMHVRLGNFCNCGIRLADQYGTGLTMQEHLAQVDRVRIRDQQARQTYLIQEEP